MNLLRFYIGISATFLAGVLIFLGLPFISLSTLEPVQDEDRGIWVPVPPNGLAEAGQDVYVSQGCIYCHTQVVTEPSFSPDLERAWGPRVTVPLDYYYQKHSLIGQRRFGPDLAFAGWEGRNTQRGGGPLTEEYILRMLYDPQLIDPRIRKPSYNFLFRQVKIDGPVPEHAIDVTGSANYPPRPGYAVVPSREAQELAAYLLSLDASYALPGAPLEVTDAGAEAPAEGEAAAPSVDAPEGADAEAQPAEGEAAEGEAAAVDPAASPAATEDASVTEVTPTNVKPAEAEED